MKRFLNSFQGCFLLLIATLVISLVQHSVHLGTEIQGVHGIRQAQTTWNIRNFVRYDANIFNPRTHSFSGFQDNVLRHEFPIMQWSIAMVQKHTGEGISMVRTSIFLIGIWSVIGFFFLIHRLTNSWPTALISAVLFQYTPVFYFYTINPFPDILALAAAMWYLYFIVKHRETTAKRDLWLASACLLLATLAKLPYLMFSIVSIVYFAMDLIGVAREKKKLPWSYAAIQLLTITPALAWYAWVMPTWTGNPILTGELGEPTNWEEKLFILKFHYDKTFPYLITFPPMWLPFWVGLVQLIRTGRRYPWVWAMAGITILFLALELTPIYTNHDYYLLPFYAWIVPVVALGVRWLLSIPYLQYALPALCIWAVLYTPGRMAAWWGIEESMVNNSVLLHSEELKNAVPNDEVCIIMTKNSNVVFAYRIDKMGHLFTEPIPSAWLNDMVVGHNINYLYSDLADWNESPVLEPFIDGLLLERGDIKVFKLKQPDSVPASE